MSESVSLTEAPFGRNGFIGSWLCGEDGSFEEPPTLTLRFGQHYDNTIPGITITWSSAYGEWASLYRVTAWHGELKIHSSLWENDSVTSVAAGDIAGYDRVDIEILAWSKPFRLARVEHVLLGIQKVYRKEDLVDFSASLSVDPLSASLPKSEINFSIVNLDGEYNPDNPKGAEKYLMERQAVTVRFGYLLSGEIQWISGGRYYLCEWDTPQNGITASFTARDAFELMSDPYSGPTSGSLGEIALAALEQASLPPKKDGGNPWTIHPSLGGIPAAPEADLSGSTAAEVLQMAANAACCVLYQDREGVIHLEPMESPFTDYEIDRFNSYSNAELTLTKQLKSIDINNGQYVLKAGNTGETQTVSNPLLSFAQAPTAALWAADFLANRRIVSGQFRADPRLDPLDSVTNENQFARSVVLITETAFTYNGAFRGSYTGRTLASGMVWPWYAGDLFCGEVLS